MVFYSFHFLFWGDDFFWEKNAFNMFSYNFPFFQSYWSQEPILQANEVCVWSITIQEFLTSYLRILEPIVMQYYFLKIRLLQSCRCSDVLKNSEDTLTVLCNFIRKDYFTELNASSIVFLSDWKWQNDDKKFLDIASTPRIYRRLAVLKASTMSIIEKILRINSATLETPFHLKF